LSAAVVDDAIFLFHQNRRLRNTAKTEREKKWHCYLAVKKMKYRILGSGAVSEDSDEDDDDNKDDMDDEVDDRGSEEDAELCDTFDRILISLQRKKITI
jgi:hypothetical protein